MIAFASACVVRPDAPPSVPVHFPPTALECVHQLRALIVSRPVAHIEPEDVARIFAMHGLYGDERRALARQLHSSLVAASIRSADDPAVQQTLDQFRRLLSVEE